MPQSVNGQIGDEEGGRDGETGQGEKMKENNDGKDQQDKPKLQN